MKRLFARLLIGTPETIAGTVYGTIVVMAALAAGGQTFEDEPWRLTVVVVVTALVFWLAHVYSHGLGESVALGHRLDLAELRAIAHRELSILLAVVLPTLALVLGGLEVIGGRAAVWLALGLATATLASQGVRYAHVEQLGRGATAATIAVNLALGLTLVALKAALSH